MVGHRAALSREAAPKAAIRPPAF